MKGTCKALTYSLCEERLLISALKLTQNLINLALLDPEKIVTRMNISFRTLRENLIAVLLKFNDQLIGLAHESRLEEKIGLDVLI